MISMYLWDSDSLTVVVTICAMYAPLTSPVLDFYCIGEMESREGRKVDSFTRERRGELVAATTAARSFGASLPMTCEHLRNRHSERLHTCHSF